MKLRPVRSVATSGTRRGRRRRRRWSATRRGGRRHCHAMQGSGLRGSVTRLVMLKVAVIGSGPAGVYSAGALTQHGEILVDVFDRLPCPFGLVRCGVAPDHPKIKSISMALKKVLENPEVRFSSSDEVHYQGAARGRRAEQRRRPRGSG